MDDGDKSGLSSMTGYGRSTATIEGWRLCVECRSVNHDRCSLRITVPDRLGWLEPKVSARIGDVVDRGRVEVRFDLEAGGGDQETSFDRIDDERFAAVTRELKRLAVDYRLVTPVSLEAAWEYRDFFERTTGEVFSEAKADVLMAVFGEAFDEMIASRQTEGQGIRRDLEGYLEKFSSHLDDLVSLREEAQTAERSRVNARLRDAIDEFNVDEIDENRLTQEVAYYVEKGDISEEIQRARSHTVKLGELVTGGVSPMGKKIDFYLQELIRETNTMSSKSRHPELTDCVIEMKSLVEKMREQAANVE